MLSRKHENFHQLDNLFDEAYREESFGDKLCSCSTVTQLFLDLIFSRSMI